MLCLAEALACATLAAMKPVESDHAWRRVAIYFVLLPLLILIPLFV